MIERPPPDRRRKAAAAATSAAVEVRAKSRFHTTIANSF